jgi:O-antigen ligase
MNLSRSRIPTIAASVAFWAWCAFLTYPMIGENIDLTAAIAYAFADSRTTFVYQAIGLIVFVSTMCAAYWARLGSTVTSLNLAQIAILLIIFLSFGLQLHDGEAATLTGIVYTGLLLVTALTLSVLWTLDAADLERCASVASVILCLFGIIAIAILGWPRGRNIGSIQPNLYAAPLLVAFILSQFRPGVLGIVVRMLCVAMIALVSSRFALIGCVTALVLHELTFDPLRPWKLPAFIIAVVAGILFSSEIASLLELDDSLRGISSGFTGRDEYWPLALATIANNPLGIGFKRTIGDESGHNGYLKIVLEFGVPGGGLIIFALACCLLMAGIDAISSSGKTRRQHRFACARFGGLVALSFGAFFQPQLLSLGDAFGVAFLFLLFKPRTKWIFVRKPIPKAAPAPMHQS